MDSSDGHSAFANRRGATLDRSGADVASCKDSGETRFERSGPPFVFAPRWGFSDVATSFNESFFVSLNFRRQPVGAWASPNHGKNRRRSNDSALACLTIFQFDLFQLFSAGHFADLGVEEYLDVFAGLYPTRKIVRH